MRLKDRVALITGSARGIGFAVATKFLEEGAKVAINGTKAETVDKAVAALKEKFPNAEIIGTPARMESTEEIEAMFKAVMDKWGRLDILVNNAGVSQNAPIETMSDEDFWGVMDINVNGLWKCCRAGVRIMKEQGSGSIINTSSLTSRHGSPNQSAYSVSKFAVRGITRALSREVGKYGIRVNSVSPGVVMTEMAKEAVLARPGGEQMMAAMCKMTALGRTATPEDMAGSFAFLASDDAAYVTGAIIDCDGGIIM